MITVVICTYNRKECLKKAIDSIIAQTFDPNLYELIVVDNNSTDGTKEFVSNKYINSKIEIKYLNEPNQGLSYCRNTGLLNANFDYVAYLDDDSIADPSWLENMAKTIENEKENEKFAGVTGHVIPIWEIPKPAWILPEFEMYYSVFKRSDEQFILTARQTPAGCNMLCKKSILMEFGGFSSKLGRTKNNLISGEESSIHERMTDKGYEFIYDPKIKLRHHVHKDRINRKWLIRRVFWSGYSIIVRENLKSKKSISTKFKQSRQIIRYILRNVIQIPHAIIFKPKLYFLTYVIKATDFIGQLYGLMTKH